MVGAGGLSAFTEEVTGSGRAKSRRYSYTHAAPRQFELELQKAAQNAQGVDA
jgi:hypothetical protein